MNLSSECFLNLWAFHIDIPSGSNINPGDSISYDICIFPKLWLDSMKEESTWIKRALDRLVSYAVGIFIWIITVANFLEVDPQVQFVILESKK